MKMEPQTFHIKILFKLLCSTEKKTLYLNLKKINTKYHTNDFIRRLLRQSTVAKMKISHSRSSRAFLERSSVTIHAIIHLLSATRSGVHDFRISDGHQTFSRLLRVAKYFILCAFGRVAP